MQRSGCRDGLQNLFKKRAQVFGIIGKVALGNAVPADCVKDWEVDLFFAGIKIDEKVVNLIDDLLRALRRSDRFC